MPRDINGNYSLPPGTLVNNGETVMPSQHNTPFNDVAATLTRSLDRDGYGGMRANLNMNGFSVINSGSSTSPTALATVQQVNDAVADSDAVNDRLTSFINSITTWINKSCHVGKVSWHNGIDATIADGDIPASGGTYSRTAYPALWTWVQAQSPISDADWLGDVNKRVKYSTGDGTTTFRVPDLNGIQSGSRKGLFLRGSGAGTVQSSQGDAIRNITGRVTNDGGGGSNGAFSWSRTTANKGGGSTDFGSISFDASLVVPTADENRPVSAIGIFTIRAIPYSFVE